MPKSFNQKLKLLYLLRVLLERSDEEHIISMKDILEYLKSNGIDAERKSIYDDIEALRTFGVDIVNRRERPSGYYIGQREFELPELKLLVDAVQSSKFITTKKSDELIKKLERLAGNNQARKLQRQVYVANRIKTMNESIYYNVDDLHEAISENKKIAFQYCEWTTDKRLVPKRGGELYNVSPWALNWDDENYYLIGYDNEAGKVKFYRVDKIKKIAILEEKREGREHFEKFNTADFSKKTFGMFAGDEQIVTMDCSEKLIGVIIDRFGADVSVRKAEGGGLKVRVSINVSPQFFGWLTGIGSDVVVTAPESVVEEYKAYIKNILEKYQL